MISSRNQPNIASAAGFQSVTTPDSSAPMKASCDASRVRERTLSARRRAATSILAPVTSAVVPLTRTAWPEGSCSARARVCAQRTDPASSRRRYSMSSTSPGRARQSCSAWLTASRSAPNTLSPKTGLSAGPLAEQRRGDVQPQQVGMEGTEQTPVARAAAPRPSSRPFPAPARGGRAELPVRRAGHVAR